MKFPNGSPWPQMPPWEWDALSPYVRRCADILGLRDWTIHLSHTPVDDEDQAAASIDILDGRRDGTIALKRSWSTRFTADEKREIIAHELIHCHFDAAAEMVRSDLRKSIGDSVHCLFQAGFIRLTEHGVDAMAMAVARFLPKYPAPPVKRRARRRKTRKGV